MPTLEKLIPRAREHDLLVLFATDGREADAELLEDELKLARILLRRRLVTPAQLADGVRLSNATGLLLEHCLVKLGAVDFDTMLAAMEERRRKRARTQR